MELGLREQQIEVREKPMQQIMLTKQRQVLEVYVMDDIKLIKESAARFLGLLEEKCFIYNDKKYYEITDKMLEKLVNEGYKIKYIKLEKVNEKELLIVFCYNNDFYIDTKLLNNLNNIDHERIDFEKNKYGPLMANELEMLKTNYNVDFVKDDYSNNDISEFKKI